MSQANRIMYFEHNFFSVYLSNINSEDEIVREHILFHISCVTVVNKVSLDAYWKNQYILSSWNCVRSPFDCNKFELTNEWENKLGAIAFPSPYFCAIQLESILDGTPYQKTK